VEFGFRGGAARSFATFSTIPAGKCIAAKFALNKRRLAFINGEIIMRQTSSSAHTVAMVKPCHMSPREADISETFTNTQGDNKVSMRASQSTGVLASWKMQ